MRNRLVNIMIALVALLPAFAGCFSATADLPLSPLASQVQTFGGAYTFLPPVAYGADGAQLDAAAALAPEELPIAIEMLVPHVGAEPNLGVTSSGSIFVTTMDETQRSRDFGRTWEVVFDFATPQYPKVADYFRTADPMLWVDTTTDRIYTNHMHPGLVCTYMAWSDDDGDTWTERPYSCGLIPGIDHQKVMTAPPGPNAPPVPMPVYPNVLYICNNKRFDIGGPVETVTLGTSCMVSLDGGLTYAYETEAYVPDEMCGNVNGHPAAYPDGTVVFIMGSLGKECTKPFTAVLSEDNGITWAARQCDPELGQVEIDADVTVTPDGTAYVLMRDKDQIAHLVRSTDKFQTCDHWRVAPPDHTMNVFAGITSGDDGRIALAYLGTRDPVHDGAIPSNISATWHAFVTTSFDADSENPTFVTQQVTPAEDPVQVGCVWMGGGGGGNDMCRNLLDFIDMVRDNEGRWYVAITDGCTPRNDCTGTPDQPDYQSKDRQVAILVQDRGLSLFAEKGILPTLGLEPPMPLER